MPREFELIDWLRRRSQVLGEAIVRGIGDDAAVLQASDRLAISKDLLIEECHFRRRWISPWLLGCKSLRVNLSDLAAMAARPLACLLGLGLPRELERDYFEPFMKGFLEEADRFGCPLIGGDLSAAPCIVVSVTVVGTLPPAVDVPRSGARPGDRIAVAGPLGESRRGLDLLRQQEFSGLCEVASVDQLERVASSEHSRFLSSHFLPEPQLEAASWLARQEGVHAMMDLSDGLTQDALRLAQASRLRAVLDVAELTAGTSGKASPDDLDIMLEGGEDYSLLFTFDPQHEDRLHAEYPPGLVTWRVVGTMESGAAEVWVRDGGQLRPAPPKGYEHFS